MLLLHLIGRIMLILEMHKINYQPQSHFFRGLKVSVLRLLVKISTFWILVLKVANKLLKLKFRYYFRFAVCMILTIILYSCRQWTVVPGVSWYPKYWKLNEKWWFSAGVLNQLKCWLAVTGCKPVAGKTCSYLLTFLVKLNDPSKNTFKN